MKTVKVNLKSDLMGPLVIGLAASLLFGTAGFAKTDVSAKVQQIKMNAENSKVNLSQYETNLVTVESNLVENDKALKTIEKQKLALQRAKSEASKGKDLVGQIKRQIQVSVQAEQAKLDQDQKQIDELKKALAAAEDKKRQREGNIAEYKKRDAELDRENGNWQERAQGVAGLEKELDAKSEQAKSDRNALIGKKATYEAEVSKWKKEVRVSERNLANFKDLK